jgi:hypothetical protein
VTTDIGGELRQARERLNLPLPELSRRTKIGVPVLQAIERNDWSLVPGGLYLRGFLRAYAREVGCDPEAIVNRYRTEYDDSSADTAADQSVTALKSTCPPGQLHSGEIDAMDRRWTRLHTIGGVAILLLGGALYLLLGWNSGRATASNEQSTTAHNAANLAAPAEPSVATAGTKPPDPSELRLEIQARESCWLSGTADGQRVVSGMVDAGSHTTIEAHKEIVLRVGDPARVSYTINGETAHLPGVAGQAITVHLTPDNYHDYLGESPTPPRAAPRPPPDSELPKSEPSKPEPPKAEPPKAELPKPEPPRPALAEPAPPEPGPIEVAAPEPVAPEPARPEPAPPEPPTLPDVRPPT